MATRNERSTKRKSGKTSSKQRQAKRAASRREGSPRGRRAETAGKRQIVAASSGRQAERAAKRSRAESAAGRQLVATPSNLSTLRVVWRPAIAMATLPYRVYRVYRWAEAESHRSSAIGSPASA